MADSIDVMMCVLFEFINELCYEQGKVSGLYGLFPSRENLYKNQAIHAKW